MELRQCDRCQVTAQPKDTHGWGYVIIRKRTSDVETKTEVCAHCYSRIKEYIAADPEQEG